MKENFEAVHVHSLDAQDVIAQYRSKGFVLQERTVPTIFAQPGFVKLIFVPAGLAKANETQKRRFWLL